MFTVVGLLGQFMQSLLAHLNKQAQVSKRKAIPVAQFADSTEDRLLETPRSEKQSKPSPSPAILWLPALIFVGLLGVWALMQFGKASKELVHNGMRLDLLGQVPVTFEGRVQPLDSFARNTLRQLCHREAVTYSKGDSTPAMTWLADGMFGVKDFEDYPTFYLTDPNIKNALDLPLPKNVSVNRKQYVYTVGEVLSRTPKLKELIPNPKKVPKEEWTPLQRRLELLRRNTWLVQNARFILGPPPQDSDLDYAQSLAVFGSSTEVPYILASDDREKPWKSMAEGMGPAWISSTAGDLKTLDAVAEKIVQESWSEDDLAESGLKRMVATPEFQELVVT